MKQEFAVVLMITFAGVVAFPLMYTMPEPMINAPSVTAPVYVPSAICIVTLYEPMSSVPQTTSTAFCIVRNAPPDVFVSPLLLSLPSVLT